MFQARDKELMIILFLWKITRNLWLKLRNIIRSVRIEKSLKYPSLTWRRDMKLRSKSWKTNFWTKALRLRKRTP